MLAEEEANDVFQKLVSFIQEQGGILEDQRLLGKKPLLAPVRGIKEGHLATIVFSLAEEKLQAIKETCNESGHILRFLLMKRVRHAKKVKTPLAAAPTPIAEQKREEKVDLKNIDEKLEEIFRGKTG